jgi:hypothetical protein
MNNRVHPYHNSDDGILDDEDDSPELNFDDDQENDLEDEISEDDLEDYDEEQDEEGRHFNREARNSREVLEDFDDDQEDDLVSLSMMPSFEPIRRSTRHFED